jgi:putative Mn2+ efflux pump MntP
MFLGFILLVVGFALAFLMTIWVIEPSFLLGFVSYMSSLLGLVIGTVGTAMHVRESHYED